MKMKKFYKILMLLGVVLLCGTVVTDANVVKIIATVGGGFLKNVKFLATVGGGFLDKAMHVIPYL